MYNEKFNCYKSNFSKSTFEQDDKGTFNENENILGCRIPSGCAVFGVLSESGKLISGSAPIEAISLMRERSNGLGGGFAVYGIYPEFEKFWSFHVFYEDTLSREETENILRKNFEVLYS